MQGEDQPCGRWAADQERDRLLGDQGGPVAVLVHGIGQPGQDVPGASAEQFVLADPQQILQAVVGVGETSVGREREEAVREPLDRRHGSHAAPGVEYGADQMGRGLQVVRALGHPAPQLDGVVASAAVPNAQAVCQYVAFLDRGTGGGPEAGQIRGLDHGRQGGRPSVELARRHSEDRAQLVVGREGSGVEIPVEQAHPDHRGGWQRDHYRSRPFVVLTERAACPQSGEGGAQPVGGGAQLPALRPRQPCPVRPGRPHHGHGAEGPLARPYGDRCRAERVGQGDRELREAPHRLLRAGQMDHAPGAVRLRHWQTAVHRDPTPPAEQGGRRPARRGHYERAVVAGEQKHASGMRSGQLHGTDDGTDQRVVALGRFADTCGTKRVQVRSHTVGRHVALDHRWIIYSILGRSIAPRGQVPGWEGRPAPTDRAASAHVSAWPEAARHGSHDAGGVGYRLLHDMGATVPPRRWGSPRPATLLRRSEGPGTRPKGRGKPTDLAFSRSCFM